jgi:hypothetical protein
MRMQSGFQARNYADIIEPSLLAGHRAKARTQARHNSQRRLIDAHRAEYEAIFAEEWAAMELEFARRLEATARKVARERGAA